MIIAAVSNNVDEMKKVAFKINLNFCAMMEGNELIS